MMFKRKLFYHKSWIYRKEKSDLFVCIRFFFFLSITYMKNRLNESITADGITERFAERSAWKGGRSEYSWGQLGQFHQRRKWHQVAVYPRGYCSRHVQPASTLDYLTLCRSTPTSSPLSPVQELSTTLTVEPTLTYKMQSVVGTGWQRFATGLREEPS